jgi:hypothetical protein
MGSFVEINDTLQLTTEQGFPSELVLNKHLNEPFTADDFKGRVFEFHDKPDLRLYHLKPTRVFLVHNINGKWLYWGHAMIIEETLHAETKTTSGKFTIEKIYTPEHQHAMSTIEVSAGKEYPFA